MRNTNPLITACHEAFRAAFQIPPMESTTNKKLSPLPYEGRRPGYEK